MPDEVAAPSRRRPQSTLAQNFSADLDNLFRISGGLDSLSQTVQEKKQAVTSQNEELEALEAKIRQAELRLKEAKSTAKPDLASQSVGASSPPRAKPQPEGANGWQAVPTRAKAPAAGRSSSNAVSSASYAHSQRSSTITDTEYVVVEREAER